MYIILLSIYKIKIYKLAVSLSSFFVSAHIKIIGKNQLTLLILILVLKTTSDNRLFCIIHSGVSILFTILVAVQTIVLLSA